MKFLNKLIQYTFSIGLFMLPLKIDTLVYQADWYGGLFNPYLSIFLNASEILILLSGLFFIIAKFIKKEKLSIGDKTLTLSLLLLVSLAVLSLIISPHSDEVLKFLLSVKLLELLIIYLLIVNKIIKVGDLLLIFIFSVSFQAIIAILQFSTQSNLGLSIIGESPITRYDPATARFFIDEIPIMRPYGTFSHPNILSAYLLTGLFFGVLLWNKIKKTIIYSLTALLILATLLSFSRVTVFALIISSFIYFIYFMRGVKLQKYLTIFIVSFALILEVILFWAFRIFNILNDNSVNERIDGYITATKVFLDHPFGVGFGLYTDYMDKISNTKLLPWEYSPPHNIFFLFLNEVGFIGLIALVSITIICILKIKKKNLVFQDKGEIHIWRVYILLTISFLLIGMFDHFLFSLEPGRYLMIINYALLSLYIVDKNNISKIKMAKLSQQNLDAH